MRLSAKNWMDAVKKKLIGEKLAEAPAKERKVSEEHPELHHYTNRAGVQGIYESQSLRASRFEAMNDPNEFLYAKKFFIDALAAEMKVQLIKRKKASLKFQRRIQKSGGTIPELANEEAIKLVETYYDATMFTGREHRERVPFCFPHIASFCTHNQDMQYERLSGLLSQWRGYGGDVGFAIVFDTLHLEKMIQRELEKFDYVTIRLFDVEYDGDPAGVRDSFSYLVHRMAEAWAVEIDGDKPDRDDHFELFLKTAPRLKHRAFFEEREVRVVAFPVFQEFRDYCIRYKVENAGRPIKQLVTTGAKPYLSLFEGLGERLPIRRIIVGPSKVQKEASEWLKRLVENKIEVCLSETPYRAD